jgi:hypothetical protein
MQGKQRRPPVPDDIAIPANSEAGCDAIGDAQFESNAIAPHGNQPSRRGLHPGAADEGLDQLTAIYWIAK